MDRLEPVGGTSRRYRLAEDAPVPRWLREATDGLLRPPEAPTLQFARVTDRVDWPTLLTEHAGDLEVAGTVGAGGPDWSGVLRAWRILDESAHVPSVDVDLEVEENEEGTILQLRHSGISTGSGRLPADEVVAAVSGALQVNCDLDWPSSSLHITFDTADGAPAPIVPFRVRHTITDTTWGWASLGPEDVPRNSPAPLGSERKPHHSPPGPPPCDRPLWTDLYSGGSG